ncbi:MAG: anaerobic ribonucleoside-triphosphate reductase activating protein [Patescibacteria group bacterium]|jgi:pyruvate formate lyase activating enzyme
MLLSGIQPFTVLDYPGKVSCIVFTPGCNFRCGYCHNPEFVLPEKVAALRPNFITEEAFFNFLDQRTTLLDGVVVSGGEPTLMSDLEQFIEKIKSRNYLVKLDSNGNRPAVLKKLLAKNLLDYIAMDVKTSLPRYQGLVGPWAAEQQIAESIRLIQDSGIEYEFRTTLVKEVHTPDVIIEMCRLLKGAKKLYLQTFRPETTLNPVFGNYHPFSEKETMDLAEQFRAHIAEVYIR